MNENNLPRKKREFISKQTKFVIALASVAGTLGLWGIFSNADIQSVSQQSSQPEIPTLATLVTANTTTNGSVAVNNNLSSLPVVTQAPSTSVSSGMVNSYQPPIPLTNTRSSR